MPGLTATDAANYTCTVSNAGGPTTSSSAALTVLPLPAGVAGAVITDLPLAYYRLNEPGPVVPDVATNSGSLGTAGDGTYFPGGLHQVPGALAGDPDTAAGYTGIDVNSEDGTVPTIVPYNAALNPNGSFTIETWLKPTLQGNLGNAQAPLNNQYDDGSGNRFGWDFFQRAAATQTPDGNGPGYSFRMFNGTAGSGAKLFNITGGLYQVGAWSHLVAVYDASVPSATLYLNGVQVAQSTTHNGSYASNPSSPLSIGGYPDGTQNPFIGSMDEVALYTNALTAAQVLDHYQNGTNAARGTPYPSLIIADGAAEYLRLDDPAHNTAVNNGSLGSLADGTYSHTINGVAGPQPPTFTGFESTNLAVSFNGTNSYVELENPAGLNFTGQVTLEAWIQPGAAQGFESYIIAHGGNDDFSGETSLRIENGVYQIGSNHGHAALPVPAGDLGGGQWVHLVGTYDGVNWNLYRNGVLSASSADNIGPFLVNNANWAIGARGKWRYAFGYPDAGLDRQFNGLIDEVAFYNYALTPSRIQAHFAASAQPLKISRSGGQITLTWPAGTLQQADNVTGTYSDVAGATSPYTISASVAQKFYRIRF
ncbi:MAG: LamG domain protein jellyroll fold domain protein [Pedosphaera sp.]|nr:LamG domain protein jellyroll fold domain protein [Pedosphaera sp.]